MANQIGIRMLNHGGGGFADEHLVDSGTTIGKFFADLKGEDEPPAGYRIVVVRNEEPHETPVRSFVLQEGDYVQITPVEIKGG